MTPQTQAALAAGTITEVPWDYAVENCPGCWACQGPGEFAECRSYHCCDKCSHPNFHFGGIDPVFYHDPNARLFICHECIDGYLAEAGTAKEAT